MWVWCVYTIVGLTKAFRHSAVQCSKWTNFCSHFFPSSIVLCLTKVFFFVMLLCYSKNTKQKTHEFTFKICHTFDCRRWNSSWNSLCRRRYLSKMILSNFSTFDRILCLLRVWIVGSLTIKKHHLDWTSCQQYDHRFFGYDPMFCF